MNTKIKGDKIKEGSIPLSALSFEIKNKLGDDKYKKLDWYYSDDWGACVAESQTNKIIINGETHDLTDEVVGIVVNDKEYGFKYGNNYEGYRVIAFSSYDEDIDILTNNVFILNDVSSSATPDWNAQQGEAGYIENKPFDYSNTDFTKFRYDGSTGIINAGYLKNYYYGNIVIFIKQANKFVHYKLSEIYGVENKKELFAPLYVYVDDTDYNLKIYAESEYTPLDIIFSSYTETKKIDGMFLDDTVIKTTPQELSDDAKNQALANLGIGKVINIDKLIVAYDENYDSELGAGIITKSLIKEVLGKYFYQNTIDLCGFPILHDTTIEGTYAQVISMVHDDNELHSLIAGSAGTKHSGAVTITIHKEDSDNYIFDYYAG